MRLYIELAKRSFQQQFAYRAATLAGLFTNVVFGVMLASIFLGLYESRGGDAGAAVNGWTADQTVTFVWINQSLLMVVYMWGWWQIIETIQSGAIVSDFLKPINYFAYWLSRDLGRALAHILIRGIPTFALGSLFFDLLLPASALRWGSFFVSIVFAVVVSFTFRFMLNLAGFWVIDHRGLNYMSMALVNLLSGFLMPLAFFPGPVRTVVELLPFRAIIMIPNEIFLGQVTPWEGLGIQLFWIGTMTLASLWVLSKGERKVVIQGG